MKKNLYSVLSGIILILGLSRGPVAAQRPDFANMDPQQIQAMIQERVLGALRDQLVVTNDAEWGVLSERLSKVLKLKMDAAFASMGGMGGMGRMGGAFAAMAPASPEADALRKAIETKAPSAEIKAKLAKFVEARKRKQTELESAQNEVRQLLTFRQESVLILAGLLE